MRGDFINGLIRLAERDDRVLLLTADLGFGVMEPFAERFPERFFNLGVTEQATVGIATGLAEGGYIPYVYSIASFAVARTFEFLRNGPVIHDLPVRLIGVGTGLDYSHDGMTHYALEDVALVSSQPNAIVIAPVDGPRAREIAAVHAEHPGLVYYRLARSVPECHITLDDLSAPLGRCLILGFGDCAETVTSLARGLREAGCDASARMCQILDHEATVKIVNAIIPSGVEVIVTVENHYIRGGFGSSLADELLAQGWGGRLLKWGVEKIPKGRTGSLEWMQATYCTSTSILVNQIDSALREERS